MDPTTCLAEILEHFMAMSSKKKDVDVEDERECAIEALGSLANWLRGGGFPPDVREAVTWELKGKLFTAPD